MKGRRIYTVLLLVFLALNTLSGIARVMGFRERFQAGGAMTRAELDLAFSGLKRAVAWQPGDARTWVLIGRVIQNAQANGLPLDALEGHQPVEMLGVGFAAVTRGIALNPADAWAWFNLGALYKGFRSARVRYERLRRAGEAAGRAGSHDHPEAAALPPEPRGLDPEDRISVAATLQALRLEPDFFFYHDILAKLFWERGLREKAAREIRKSLALTPRLPAHGLLKDDDLVRDLAGAILEGIDQAASNRFVSPVMVARARAEMLAKLDRFSDAASAYLELRELGDWRLQAECDLALGKLAQRRGRYRESIPLLERAVNAGTENPWGASALYYLGLAHARLGEHRKSSSYLRRYLEKDPDSIAGYHALAEQREKLGDSEEAERLYTLAVRKFRGDPAAYWRLIQHMRRHGKAREALAYAEALRRIDPHDGAVGTLLLQLGREAADSPRSR